MRFRLSRQAEQDLIEIYIASVDTFGPIQAEHYQDLLEQAFDLIAEFPLVARERSEMNPPARVHPVSIRHGAEDWQSADPG
jgi:toxin ParE1/3/4